MGSLQLALGRPWAACTGRLRDMILQTVLEQYSTVTVFYA